MPQVLKDNSVIEDIWLVLDESFNSFPDSDLLIPFNQWESLAEQRANHDGRIGVIIEGNAEIEEIIKPLLNLPLIAINFPKFADGRGFSCARLLRERYHYKGEIRAVGGFMRDQLFLLQRCGFNAFKFADDINLIEAAESLQDFSETYQVSADEDNPLFRRR
jgi:uncharacterized protein (DUF934 family)